MSQPDSSPKKSSNLARTGSFGRRAAIVTVVVVVLYAVVGYWVVPAIVESQLIGLVEQEIGVTPKVEAVHFDPFDLRLSLHGFELPSPEDGFPIVSFEQLAVDVRLLGFLNADLALEEVLLVRPLVSAVVDEEGRLNFAELMAGREQETEPEEIAEEAVSSSSP